MEHLVIKELNFMRPKFVFDFTHLFWVETCYKIIWFCYKKSVV